MDIKEIRRSNLLLLASKHGGMAALAKLVGVDPTYLGNIKNRVKTPGGTERGMGDEIARRIEQSPLALSAGWMDQYHPTASDEAAEQELVENYRRASRTWRDHILDASRRARQSDAEIEAEPPPSEKTHSTATTEKKFRTRK